MNIKIIILNNYTQNLNNINLINAYKKLILKLILTSQN